MSEKIMMKEYVVTEWEEFTIVELSSVVSMELDPTMQNSLQFIFDWANKMGLKGQAMRNLTFIPPAFDNDTGLVVGGKIKCHVAKIEQIKNNNKQEKTL